ncbi:alpha-D-ribose 1-methylphosphonate 5-triphosphate diphosphatase [Sulfitobacter guttiformis]|uniref:Alpha-D-ribose 1-methylphosphonate 5-triphosphate diphosphatase n=1 Tax=Sulfitobacter guttiformis TaxID=74349 RepID=A0A420DTJ1_9RHOB|nr:alpha-D-ribose 1-methylphosphonate 5-triphosphate diphosphatase [Sulfitobacter guttiformis]KIN71014.1 Alkylphosphonate utilization protein PhnM [Sulfitobacter guttiformis KCTC 32187]RKE97498.1 alpha-D-ribose 1-methylphosphonate 5-triphosphate diphosphatase [Sulfitobacter guttiformis]
MQHCQNIRLSGAHVLRAETLVFEDVALEQGLITDDLPKPGNSTIDLSGYLVLPGIIDLHSTAFERQVPPRPDSGFPIASALWSVGQEAAAQGITTAWLGQSWSWEGGKHGPDFAETFLDALADYRQTAVTDLRVQLRCDIHCVESQERLLEVVRRYGIDYIIFHNQIPQRLDLLGRDRTEFEQWGLQAGYDPEAYVALVRATARLTPYAPRFICSMATAFDAARIRYGSSGDRDAPTRAYYDMIGARICEFPTAYAPARVARIQGNPIVAGAHDVLRARSQIGGSAAIDLVRNGLCDALVSGAVFAALSKAAFSLGDAGIVQFGAAWHMISGAPARIMGMSDRGEIAAGKRADLVFFNQGTRRIEGTMVAGRWSYLRGGLADRFAMTSQATLSAAE